MLREGVIVGLANHTVLIAKDGTERPIDDCAAPIRDAAGKLIGVVLIFRDVTEQRRAEQELRASEARKSAILETALDCIITMDHEGNVVEFNPAAERTFGYRREQVIGQELADFIIPPSLRERHRRAWPTTSPRAKARSSASGSNSRPCVRTGREFPVELAITRIPTDGPPLFTAYLRDITEAKRAEQHRNARLAVTHALSEAASVDDGAERRPAGGVRKPRLGRGLLLDGQRGRRRRSCVGKAGTGRTCRWTSSRRPVAAARSRRGKGCRAGCGPAANRPGYSTSPQDANFPRLAAAVEYGLHSAFACPVVVGDRTLGVIEFFTKRIREPDADLLEMMGTVAGNVGQFIERKAAEDELRRSEQELADFFENATVGLHWVGPDGIILRANRAELDMLGYSREEYVGRPIADFHADEDVICDILSRLQAGEELHEYPARLGARTGRSRTC